MMTSPVGGPHWEVPPSMATIAKDPSMTIRMRTIFAAAGLAGVLALGGQLAAIAQDKTGDNISQESAKADEPATAKLYAMARDLVDYGRANNDPLSLIVAAGIRQQIALTEVDRKPSSTEGSGAAAEDPTPELTVEAILDEAKSMSGDDEAIVALADDVTASATKGRSAGPGYNVVTLPGNTTDNYDRVDFNGGEYAEVYAEGSGATNLDLYVYDENGNLICSDTDYSDIAYCGWTPKWTGPFSIKVINQGSASNRYALITN